MRRLRAARHGDKPVLNKPFSPILHKKFPKCVSIPGILLFVLKKSSYFKTASHRKKVEILARQGKKRRNTWCIASIFDAVWRG